MNYYIDEETATMVFTGICAVIGKQPLSTQVKGIEFAHELIHGVVEERKQAAAAKDATEKEISENEEEGENEDAQI